MRAPILLHEYLGNAEIDVRVFIPMDDYITSGELLRVNLGYKIWLYEAVLGNPRL